MHLVRLELYGFKSFANRTEFSFSPGITTFVGPNGCGKSNVVDAVRWVLGEQNLRVLRATKLTDLIYAGSEKSEQKNYAEVAVVLDNSDNEIPLDFREVTIARRYYRSGESEYFLNRVSCRLRDINEVLASTSLGRGTYSIIGQGEVAEVITSKPEDRRLMFEEAAGISLYKMRKAEAIKKLGATQVNLQRVEDIIYELRTQTEDLQQGAEKAKTFIELKKQANQMELALWAAKYSESLRRRRELEADQKKLQALQENEVAACAELEVQLGEATAAFEECSQFISTLEGNRGALEADRTYQEYQLKLTLQRLDDEAKLLLSARQRLDLVRGQAIGLKKETSRIEQELAASGEAAKDYASAYRRRQVAVGALKGFISAVKGRQTKIDNSLEKAIRGSSEYAAGKETNRALAVQLDEQLESQRAELANCQQDLRASAGEIAERSEALADLKTEATTLKEKLAAISEKTKAAAAELKHENTNRLQLETAQQALTQKIEMLQVMEEELQGYGPGVRAVLKAGAQSRLTGIRGAVGRLTSVKDPQHSLAVETALGAALQYIVCETETACQKAIAYLKQNAAGRATLIPLTAAGVIAEKGTRKQFGDKVLGWADELVHCSPEIKPVLRMLLGNTLVAKDLAAATELAQATNYRYKTVTLDGDVISRGLYTGGSRRGVQGPLHRKTALETAKNERAALQADLLSCRAKIAPKEAQLGALEREGKVLADQLQTNETKLIRLTAIIEEARLRANQFTASELACQERLHQTEARIAQVSQQLQSLALLLDKDQTKLGRLKATKEALNRGEQELEDQLALWTARLNSLRLSQYSWQNRSQNLAEALTAVSEQVAAAATEASQLTKEIADRETQSREKDETIAAARHALQEIAAGLESVGASIEGQSSARDQYKSSINAAKKDLAQRQEENKHTTAALHELDIKSTRLETELETLVSQLLSQHGHTPEKALTYADTRFSPGQLAGRVRAVQEQISQLGEVNLAAIQQHEKHEARLLFLTQQQSDLVHASKDIQSLVAELDQTIRAMFLETFAKVQESFARIFKILFDGGSAYLSLSDEGDPLETGIEIFARPLGKRTQSLTLLSGGEKALTAIALLFALQSARSSPFSILDEIEAALDDTNILRFTKYLRLLAQDMQFILITHRRETMEHSDSLYGITLNEEGASQPLSIVLSKEKKRIEGQ